MPVALAGREAPRVKSAHVVDGVGECLPKPIVRRIAGVASYFAGKSEAASQNGMSHRLGAFEEVRGGLSYVKIVVRVVKLR